MTMPETTTTTSNMLLEVAYRIRELREIEGLTVERMAELTDLTVQQYEDYEAGVTDLPFSFIHKCALAFGVGITDLLEGKSANLSTYTVTRRGAGQIAAREQGIEIMDLAPLFRRKLAEPYFVRYDYLPEQQNSPIQLATHSGQEFDLVLSGRLKVQIGDHVEVLSEGDSIYYNSSTPHGMIAVDGAPCTFVAVVLAGEKEDEKKFGEAAAAQKVDDHFVYENFVDPVENEKGELISLTFKNEDRFNFGFDVVDAVAEKHPTKLAMLHLDRNKVERRFTFDDLRHDTARVANYFTSLGIKKGDRVMLVLRRNYQFWQCIVALHKLGAVAIPATDQLVEKDYVYRFNAAKVDAVVCTADTRGPEYVELALPESPTVRTKILVGGEREGWHNYDRDYLLYRSSYQRTEDTACGADPAVMLFTSGTTGYPKIALHTHKYALGHFITAKYWHNVDPGGIHFTISDTGWGKALWGKLYGQWLCEAAVFTYDFERFDANDILPMFKQYNITTFCAPPTMYRFMVKEDLSKFDLSSIRHATTAGEALNPEVFNQFKAATGLSLMEGFGQTETTLLIATLVGTPPKVGSMGRPSPLYDVMLMDSEGNPVPVGETGEIVIRATPEQKPCGLYSGYYLDDAYTDRSWHDGYYHTGDTAWCDEDGYYWYVGRVDDLIKSSGYRIGPFEIESVIMELPYVLECGVSPVPDEVRGQIVKASIVLTKGTEPTEELKKEIQSYVKAHTAPYKYPRIIVFRDELPKTISGKIQRNKL